MEAEPSHLRLWTVKDVASRMGCSQRHVERLIRRGELRSLKIGGLRRVVPTDFADFLFGEINDWHEVFGSTPTRTSEEILEWLRQRGAGTFCR